MTPQRSGGLRTSYREDARVAARRLGPVSETLVPTSATMHFGAWLGWPDWLRQGTSLGCSGPLPAHITAADDLTIIANVLEHEGPAKILRRTLSDIRFPVGPLAALAFANSPTLGHALNAFARLTNVHRDYFEAEVGEDDRKLTLALHRALPPSDLAHVAAAIILTLAYRLVASYSFRIEKTVEIRCTLPRDRCEEDYWTAFECVITAGTETNELSVETPLAATPNVLADPGLWHLALEQIADLERQKRCPDAVGVVRRRVADALVSEHRAPRMKEMSGEAMSERTIARQLAAHGTSFHTIVDEERRHRAAILINDPSLSLAEVAERLGFNDMSSFGRSFRQWFGMSPGKFRTRTDVVRS